MDKPIQMAIGVGLAIAAMAIVGVYVFGVIGGSTVSTDIVPKTLDAISSNQGKSLQLSVSLTNQGSGSVASVGAVLRMDASDVCSEGSSTNEEKCTASPGLGKRAIYFPVSYSEDVVESFGTINIRTSIETSGDQTGGKGVGCSVKPEAGASKIGPTAGFDSLDKAIEYVSVADAKVTTDEDVKGILVSAETTDVLCARNLGVFAGEEITLTVIAKTTSGDTIERIIPLTVR